MKKIKRKFTEQEIDQIIEMYINKAMSSLKISEIMGCSPHYIRSIIKKNGMETRGASDAMILLYYKNKEQKIEYQKLLKSIKNHFYSFMWKAKIAVRDNFTCQNCGYHNDFGIKYKEMHIDHIKPFIKIFRENNIYSLEQALNCPEFWNTDNGRCLCADCHRKTDTYSANQKFKKESDISITP